MALESPNLTIISIRLLSLSVRVCTCLCVCACVCVWSLPRNIYMLSHMHIFTVVVRFLCDNIFNCGFRMWLRQNMQLQYTCT